MATISYLVQTLDDPDGAALQASRASLAALGLPVDREFVERPGGYHRDHQGGDFRVVAIDQRPVGRDLFAALKDGDVLLVDNPMVPRSQLVKLFSVLAKRGASLHVAGFERSAIASPQLAAASLSWCADVERRCARGRALDAKLEARAAGRPTGPAPLGFKAVRDRRGKKRLVPDPEQRQVMMEIVKRRLEGWGWRRISSFLTKNRIMYKVPDRKARKGFRLEFWSFQRCERAYHAMLRILAEESREQAAGDQSEQPLDGQGDR